MLVGERIVYEKEIDKARGKFRDSILKLEKQLDKV